ncbi:uncharacterized protein NEMAJ01_1857 [Nematocida major]|uniref:uncharacterized protein n=1 Tax=Nematocida major TaxID=1912982 RepID=UPI0020077A2A|nr:uncharacterized protein NEMAJ01_1857 [Nematocida major]KAH9386961.1 hypothetical protein NEMAJ01_1857 [Nematocida major]
MFEKFTIRTKPYETSPFQSEPGFSLLKMLSFDPIGEFSAEECISWAFLTLLGCCIYYFYGVIKKRVSLRILGKTKKAAEKRQGAEIDCGKENCQRARAER